LEKNEERKSGSSHVANTKTPLQKVGDFSEKPDKAEVFQ